MHITKRLVKRSVLVLLSLVLAAMLLVSFYAQSMTSAFAAEYATEAKKFYTDFRDIRRGAGSCQRVQRGNGFRGRRPVEEQEQCAASAIV